MSQETFYSLEEISDNLKVAYLTVYRWVQDGKLIAHQVGKQYRVSKKDFDSFVESRKKPAASPKLQDLSKDQLIGIIKHLKRQKKFGLVWEDKLEDVAERCQNELPVLEQDESKKVLANNNGTTNFLIEGDNFHTLSVLNYTHADKIDVIYIDPPYNTGNQDFIYNDKFVDTQDSFRHSKWLSFMEKRLVLARSLLSANGLIFISIDDNEQAFLKVLCDQTFGEENYRATIAVKGNPRGRDYGGIARMHDYILVYSRTPKATIFSITDEDKEFPFQDERGGFEVRELRNRNIAFNIKNRPNLYYAFYINPNKQLDNGFFEISLEKEKGWIELYPKESQGEKTVWRWGKPRSKENLNTEIVAKKMQDGGYQIVEKYRKKEKMVRSIWDDKDVNTEKGTLLLKRILGKKTFGYPKPVEMIMRIIEMGSVSKTITVLDFFAGSGTTGQAVLELNKKDEGKRKFILCTNNEDNNGAGKIATDICYPRIKSVIEGYDDVKGIPSNFRYFKTSFVSKSKVTDDMRRELVKRSTEMICVRENTFEKVTDKVAYKIYRDTDHVTGILFDLNAIAEFKKELETQQLPAHLYVFSLSNDTYDEDFADLTLEHELCPIPESILAVYRKLFRKRKNDLKDIPENGS